jgi:Cu(I)/Ag(I) efflux system membrane fusion protein
MAATNTQIQQSTDTLRAMGMSATQIEAIGKTRQRTYTVEIRSPAAGFVLSRKISPGQRFESGDELYVIGDLGRVWILADVFEYDAKWLRAGSAARVVYQAEGVPAVVSEVLPIFDDDARTMKFRLELPNPGFRFKPGMFVDVEFPLRLESTLTVPASAVVDSGTRKTVFVDRGGGYFEPRAVETGWRLGDHVEIVKGLMAGDPVAVSGTFLIDSESRMQAASPGAGPAPKAAQTATDVVCGMDVDRGKAVLAGRTAVHDGTTYYFCSDQCKKDFGKDPRQYLK